MNPLHDDSSAPRPPASPAPENAPAQPDLRSRPLHDEIAACARDLWRSYGCPVGRDEAIWLEAERQILGVDSEVVRVAGQPSAADALNHSTVSGSSASPGGEGQEVRADRRASSEPLPARASRPGTGPDAELAASSGPVSRGTRRGSGAR